MAFKGGMYPQYIETDSENRAIVTIAGGTIGGTSDATAANQTSQITLETAIRDQLISILAKLIASPATEATSSAILNKLITAPATEAKQDTLLGRFPSALVNGRFSIDGSGVTQPISGSVHVGNFPPTQEVSGLFATQTTLLEVRDKLIAAPATEAKQTDILNKLIAAPATEAKQTAFETLATAIRDRLVQSGDRIKTEANIRVLTEADTVSTVGRGSSTATSSRVASTASSTTLLVVNSLRKRATFFNDSTAVLKVKCGDAAAADSYTIKIASQSFWEMSYPYTGNITGIWDAANGYVYITEFTYSSN